MFRCLCMVIGLLIVVLPQPLLALDAPSVLVLPFDVEAAEDSAGLSKRIAGVMEKNLQFEGFSIIKGTGKDASAAAGQAPVDRDAASKAGLAAGADYVIWGTLRQVGEQYAIHAQTLIPGSTGPPASYASTAENTAELYKALQRLTDAVAMKVMGRNKIADVKVTGNVRIEADAILRQVETASGDLYSEKRLARDLKAIYAMGYFDDIRILAEDSDQGRIITFDVKEKPTIRNINIRAGKVIEEEKLKESLTISTGAILNIFKLRNNVKIIESMYREKKYYNVQVAYSVETLENNLADVTFTIMEGEKIKIKEIIIEGNNSFPDKKIKKVIRTSEKGFWSWLTSSGDYNPDELNQDAEIIHDFYLNEGFIESRVADPVVEFKDKWIFVTFKIYEGERFKVGKVSVEGDIIIPEEALTADLNVTQSVYFGRRNVQKDILRFNEIYADEGYAYPEVVPLIKPNREQLTVDITFDIKKGKEVYFERINITGNTRTRDKVIRRELRVFEQEKYSGKKLKRSVRNLHRLDFFEDVKVDPIRGSSDEQMQLNLHVVEKSTGYFSFGAGYSSVENLYGTLSLTERNLFGRGQQTEIKAELGGVTTKFNVSFTEPWLFDIPLSASLNLYNWKVAYDYYDKDGKGGSISMGYPVYDYTRIYFTYAYDSSIIKNISYWAANEIKELEGKNITSSVSTTLRYDSRDKAFNPTEGGKHSVSVEYAGLGGDIGFVKYMAETGWYLPFYKKIILFLHGKTGFIHKKSDKILPDYEKFYLGGINSVRGYGWQGIYSLDNSGFKIGGDKFVQANIELNIPLIEAAGLMGVIFYDTGEVYKRQEKIDLLDLSQSIGGGFRWYSPMGPMRIEYGYILNPKPGQSSGGRWEFSVGGAF